MSDCYLPVNVVCFGLDMVRAVDIWAAGLVLYAVCFNKHPFEDSNKLAIVNGNYKIPSGESRYKMFQIGRAHV